MSAHPLQQSSDCDPISAVFTLPLLRDGTSAAPTGRLQSLSRSSSSALGTWRAAYDRGRETWKTVRLSYEELEAHAKFLAHRELPTHATDLYLTAACKHNRRSAILVLEREFIQRSRGLVLSVVRDASVVDDVLQDVFTRLVVGPTSKVARFRGTGPLGAWVRSVALNVARDYLRTETSRRRAEKARARAFSQSEGATLSHSLTPALEGEHRLETCVDALRLAFQSLEPFERQLLHDHYVRGLSIDALAPHCRVNRATVARRIRRAADEVARQARKRLGVLYPREDERSLDALALSTCLELITDPIALLDSGGSRGDGMALHRPE